MSPASVRTRSIWRWQLILAAATVTVTATMAVLDPARLTEPAFLVGSIAVVLLTAVALLLPWQRVPPGRSAAVAARGHRRDRRPVLRRTDPCVAAVGLPHRLDRHLLPGAGARRRARAHRGLPHGRRLRRRHAAGARATGCHRAALPRIHGRDDQRGVAAQPCVQPPAATAVRPARPHPAPGRTADATHVDPRELAGHRHRARRPRRGAAGRQPLLPGAVRRGIPHRVHPHRCRRVRRIPRRPGRAG